MLNFLVAWLKNRLLRLHFKRRSVSPVGQENLRALDHLSLFQPARSYSYVVVDLETTGLDVKTDRVLSIGAFRIKSGRIRMGDMFSTFVNPERDIPATAIKMHGIVPDMVKDAATAVEVLDEFLAFLGNDIMVAHHAAFDLGFINRMMSEHYGFVLQNMVVDTVPLCQQVILPQFYTLIRRYTRLSTGRFGHIPMQKNNQRSLDHIANHLGIQIYKRHTAVGDALATAMIFQRVLSRLEKAGRGKLVDLVNTGAL
jgi:DNA polymerase-3 subunit epsilon